MYKVSNSQVSCTVSLTTRNMTQPVKLRFRYLTSRQRNILCHLFHIQSYPVSLNQDRTTERLHTWPHRVNSTRRGSVRLRTPPRGSDRVRTPPRGSDRIRTSPCGSDRVRTRLVCWLGQEYGEYQLSHFTLRIFLWNGVPRIYLCDHVVRF